MRPAKDWPVGRSWLAGRLEQEARRRRGDWLVFWGSGVVLALTFWWLP